MALIALICLSLWQPTTLSEGFSLRGVHDSRKESFGPVGMGSRVGGVEFLHVALRL